jgi:hypothetical protein
VLFVLVAILVVMSRNGRPDERPPGAAQAFLRAAVAQATTVSAPAWADIPVATSVVELGPALAQPVADGLADARARISRCVAVELRRRSAARPESGESGPAELVLDLAPRAGAVHVVGVEVAAMGASEVLADCARRHLDGDAFPASAAVPGRRHRLLVTIR